ncbi:MAG: AbrB/MazE/SpoVT family DNA-binding domain-containing protein [Candidatus Thiothrix singaporensis]|uniref:AbrB/MazE/SpoVT family DNA-binding domain-containing protein n=1 Tax=Candidatus Thiothrix singaporensis TaxID=2799669 RepID=A0A7L6ANL9_9GAMM|nr:MAG: AbrB/MazE/SpoVT family DNA-binding domain-containing protein [Candidatus Thiothrix singaporensis]
MSQVLLQQIESQWITTLPQEIIDALHLHAGQTLEIKVEAGRIVLAPHQAGQANALRIHEELLEQYHDAFQRLAQ